MVCRNFLFCLQYPLRFRGNGRPELAEFEFLPPEDVADATTYPIGSTRNDGSTQGIVTTWITNYRPLLVEQ